MGRLALWRVSKRYGPDPGPSCSKYSQSNRRVAGWIGYSPENASLNPCDPDALPDVLPPDKRHFLAAKAVAVHDVEKQPIPSVQMWDRCEKPFDFRFGEVSKLLPELATDDVHFRVSVLRGTRSRRFYP